LADVGRGDWILCQITSNPYGDALAIPLGSSEFDSGGLKLARYARPGKLFTAHAGLLIRSVGVLNSSAFADVLAAVASLFQPPATP